VNYDQRSAATRQMTQAVTLGSTASGGDQAHSITSGGETTLFLTSTGASKNARIRMTNSASDITNLHKVGVAGGGIAGSLVGDFTFTTNARRFLWSVDNGTAISMLLSATRGQMTLSGSTVTSLSRSSDSAGAADQHYTQYINAGVTEWEYGISATRGRSASAAAPGFYIFANGGIGQLFTIGQSGAFDIGPAAFTGHGTEFHSINGTAKIGNQLFLGRAGGDYDSIGYNFRTSGVSGTYHYNIADFSSRLQFASGGFQFFTAPTTVTPGSLITYTNAVQITATATQSFNPFQAPVAGVSAPGYAFPFHSTSGLSYDGTSLRLGIAGVSKLTINPNQILISDGTASSPAIAFASDIDTGIYRVSSNEVSFGSAGFKMGSFIRSAGSWVQAYTDVAGAGAGLWLYKNTGTACQWYIRTGLLTDTTLFVFKSGVSPYFAFSADSSSSIFRIQAASGGFASIYLEESGGLTWEIARNPSTDYLDYYYNNSLRYAFTQFGSLQTKSTVTVGTASSAEFFDNSGDLCGKIEINASSNTTQYLLSSDRRLKDDIETLNNAIALIEAVDAKTFHFRSDPEKTSHIGFIAQDMNEVLPDSVSKGDPWMMDYGRCTPILWQAIKELHKKIKDLEDQILSR